MFKYALVILLSAVTFTASASYQTEFDDHLQPRFERIQPMILEVARRQNVDPVLLTTAIYKESRFKATAKNPHSTATGTMQMLKGTAAAMIEKHGKELGIARNADLHNPRISLKLGAAYLSDIKDEMTTALRRPVSNGEIYLGYKYGPRTAASLIKKGKHRKRNGTIAEYRRAAAFYADLTPAVKKPAKKSVQLAFAKPNNLNDLQAIWGSLYGTAVPKGDPDTYAAISRTKPL